MNRYVLAAAGVAALLLTGCAGLPLQQGRDGVTELAATRGVALDTVDDRAAIPATLDRDAAVRVALSRNPELRASLASLGFGAADVYEAGRIANPVLEWSQLDSDVSGRRETWRLVMAFTDALTLPARRRMADADFAALQHTVSSRALETAVAAERAWLAYAAARARAGLRRDVAETGIVSAELAERFRSAGNLTPRELAEQRAATAMLQADAIAAEAEAEVARAMLAGVLGIGAGGDWTLDDGLRVPPAMPPALEPLLDTAPGMRLDLAAARMRADALATRAGVENWSRWLRDIELGAEREREPDGERLDGPSIAVRLPVFDTGRGRVARARAALAQQAEVIRRIELDIDNGLRAAHARLDAAHRRVVTYRDALLPARRRAVDEASAQYNFMLIGVFELLGVKRQEIEAWQGYVDAVTDYWQAHADLALAAGRRLPVPDTPALVLMPTAEAAPSHDHGGMHEQHGMQHDMGGASDTGDAHDAHGMDHGGGMHGDDDHDGHADDADTTPRPADGTHEHEHEDAARAPRSTHEHGATS